MSLTSWAEVRGSLGKQPVKGVTTRTRVPCHEVCGAFLICAQAATLAWAWPGPEPAAQSRASGYFKINGFIKKSWETLFHFQKRGKSNLLP